MPRLIYAMMLALMLPGLAAAQDWRQDSASESSYNCDLVDALAEQYGSENILQTEAGEVTTLSEFLIALFPECPRWDDSTAEEPVPAEGRIAELVESDDVDTIRVLVEGAMLEWGDPACSIMVGDIYESDFNVVTRGHSLEAISVDVYQPGASQPAEMDVVLTDVTQDGLPIRTEWLEGDEFPLGDYVFEVHIDGETSHFVWKRNDNAINTFSLICPDRPVASAADATREDIEVTAVLNDRDIYSIADDFCSVIVTDQFESDLNVSMIALAIDHASVKVYLPGEDQAIAMPMSQTDQIEAYGRIVPTKTWWAERDSFPLGAYTIDVQTLGETYRFEWNREDSAVNTIVVICTEMEALPEQEEESEAEQEPALETTLPDIDVTARLTDGEFHHLDDAGCFVATSNLDSPLFGFAVSGSDHEAISFSVAYPGESTPMRMDQRETLVGEGGFPYRVEWVDEDEYPLGVYTIAVSMPGHEFLFEWDRQDDDYRTIFFSCSLPEDEE